ncbi:MAG: FumA C-terminus/TtdB family hydratase beta subunit [Zestosphaera sp.]
MSRVINLPTTDDVVSELKVGDVIYISGVVVTARDAVHRRFLVEGLPLPVDLRGLAILHAGPVMVRSGSKWVCQSIGPTTSMRMEYYEDVFIEKTGIKLIIGKGGMGRRTAEACQRFKAVYTIFPGGCGALGASAVEEVLDVEWLDLGVPEALWLLRVREFGPLIVAIDTQGGNLTEDVVKVARSRVPTLLKSTVERL